MTIFELGATEQLLAAMLEESGGELTPQIEEMMNDNDQQTQEKIDGYAAVIREFQYRAECLKTEAAKMTERAKQSLNAAEKVRQHILLAMNTFKRDKYEGNTVKFFKKKTQSVEADEEEVFGTLGLNDLIEGLNLPDYITVKFAINKTAIKDGVKKGKPLPQGISITENDSVIMR